MKKLQKLFVILLVLALSAEMSFAAAPARTTATVGSKSANIVTYAFENGSDATVTLASDSVNKDMNFSAHIEKAKSEIGAVPSISVNGGYFNAYYSTKKALSFPDNCALTYAMIIKEGKILNGGGGACMPTIGFTADGKVMIDKVVTQPYCLINGLRYDFWSVNNYFSDPTGFMLFTPENGYPINLPSDAVALYVLGDSIVKVQTGGTVNVTEGYKVIVFQHGFWTAALLNNRIEVGSTVEFGIQFSPRKGNAGDWNRVKTAVSAGPWLVSNGTDVTWDNAEYPEAKQQPDYVAGRTFAGIKADGTLVICTGTCSPRQAANYLISIGCTDGMCLDGGASSALAMNGQIVQNAGRKLSNVLHITEASKMVVVNTPSNWAVPTVNEAISKALVPAELQSKYKFAITRAEFCKLVTSYLRTKSNYSTIISGGTPVSFTDTADPDVLICASLGIVNGVGNNKFSPSGLITREQAAKMLKITSELAGRSDSGTPLKFADSAKFSSWAVEGIDYCTRTGILNGTGENFNPKGNFTREQAIATMLRMTY